MKRAGPAGAVVAVAAVAVRRRRRHRRRRLGPVRRDKSMFGVETTFDESMYTTSIDRSGGGITEAEAARIAREIESGVVQHPRPGGARAAPGRRLPSGGGSLGAVIGAGAAGGRRARQQDHQGRRHPLPSKPAWGSSKVPEGVARSPIGNNTARGRPRRPSGPGAGAAPRETRRRRRPSRGVRGDPAVDKPAGEKPKSTLSASAKPFSLSASAAAFVPAAKKPAAPPAPAAPVGYPGFPGGMIPPAMMMPTARAPTHGRLPPARRIPRRGFPGGGGGRGMGGRGGANPAQAAAAAAAAAAAYGRAVPRAAPSAPGGDRT